MDSMAVLSICGGFNWNSYETQVLGSNLAMENVIQPFEYLRKAAETRCGKLLHMFSKSLLLAFDHVRLMLVWRYGTLTNHSRQVIFVIKQKLDRQNGFSTKLSTGVSGAEGWN